MSEPQYSDAHVDYGSCDSFCIMSRLLVFANCTDSTIGEVTSQNGHRFAYRTEESRHHTADTTRERESAQTSKWTALASGNGEQGEQWSSSTGSKSANHFRRG